MVQLCEKCSGFLSQYGEVCFKTKASRLYATTSEQAKQVNKHSHMLSIILTLFHVVCWGKGCIWDKI